jgi:hypothetical protein
MKLICNFYVTYLFQGKILWFINYSVLNIEINNL